MFWGLIMEPNKRYTQTVEKAFHLSMASLDASTASGGLVQVMICYDNRNYLLCTLQKGSIWQVPLDLNFQEGTKIAFTCNGDGHVHLTGYLIPEDEGLDELDDFEEDEEEEDEEIPQLVSQKKRKALNSPKEKNDLKRAKKLKVESEEDEDDDDDDDSDSDNEVEGLDDDSDDDSEGVEIPQLLDDDEDDSDEDDDDDEEEVETPVKPSKKEKQKQKQQNQQNHQQNQNQQQSKKDKNKLVNGKDVKSEKEQGKQKKNKDDSKTEDKSEQQQQQQQQKRRTVEGGVQVEDVKIGNGAPVKAGKFISVYYIGRLKNGKKFDQTQQGEGFKFRLGKGEVIKGWDVGIVGMKVGGKRRIVIPPNMAYGAKGSPPLIPPNSALNFEVELKAIH